jgi:alkylation response protein AidB-like acyl-CoA dehydrogenase
MTALPPEALAGLPPALRTAATDAITRLAAISPTDDFRPAAADALVAAGLARLALPVEAGGFGAGLSDAGRVLAAIGAIDGSAALGLAMNTHVIGALAEGGGWPATARDRLYAAVRATGALVNNAATEERGGSPARGALPDTVARPGLGGVGWVLDGEKAWTTFLPALRFAVVSARIEEGALRTSEGPGLGNFLVDLGVTGRAGPGVTRLPALDAMGMRGSASGRLRLSAAAVPPDALVGRRPAAGMDPRGVAPAGWFAGCIAAVYLGVGEGARTEVVRWAVGRRPADGT